MGRPLPLLALLGLALCACERSELPRAGATDAVAAREAGAQAAAELALARIDEGVSGRLGACVATAARTACVRPNEPFPMQSVMKLLVAVAAFERADRGEVDLAERVTLTREDISLGVQPLADVIRKEGSVTITIDELILRMLAESDSTATDSLVAHFGGIGAIQESLDRASVPGLRIDRTERELQSEPRSVPGAALADIPADLRDTATPRALTMLLQRIADGRLLSRRSADRLIAMLVRTRTFPDRLTAGAPPGWTVAHKTGTGPTVDGYNQATNDVGYLIAPDGSKVVAVALLAGSGAPPAERASAVAAVARTGAQFGEALREQAPRTAAAPR